MTELEWRTRDEQENYEKPFEQRVNIRKPDTSKAGDALSRGGQRAQ